MSPIDSAKVARVKAAFSAIDRAYFNLGRSERNDSLALVRGRELIAEGLDPTSGHVASETIFRALDLASRLPNRQALLDTLADAGYAYELADTTASGRSQYILAMGVLENNRGDVDASNLFLDSVLLFEGRDIAPVTLSTAHVMRGYNAQSESDFVTAAVFFERATQLLPKTPGSEYLYSLLLDALASSYIRLGRMDEALAASTAGLSALETYPGGGDAMAEAYSVYLNHAQALLGVGRVTEAIEHATYALHLATEREDQMRMIRTQVGVAKVFLEGYRMDDVEPLLLDAYETAQQVGEKQLALLAQELFVELYRRQGHYRLALERQLSANAIAEEIRDASQATRILDLREEHEDAEMRQTLALSQANADRLAAEQESDRIRFIAAILLVVALAAALGWLVSRLRSRRRAHDELGEMVAARTAELEARTEQLDRQARRLKRSNTELERFAYIASHDLKTPIRNVTSFLGLVNRRLRPEARADVAEYIDLATGYAHQMQELVTGVLEFSRIDADVDECAERIDLNAFLKHVARTAAPERLHADASVEVTGEAAVELPGHLLRQVFANLIENGLKYNRSLFPRVHVAIREREGAVEVAVTDNGIGIAEEYRGRVFEMFQRLHTQDEFPGTGLGLAVCHKVAERLGGALTLESEVGAGSCFTIRLPRYSRLSPARTRRESGLAGGLA